MSSDWRREVLGHFSFLILNFNADKLADEDGIRDRKKLSGLSNEWEPWSAQSALEFLNKGISYSNSAGDCGSLGRTIDDAHFFLQNVREIAYPEFARAQRHDEESDKYQRNWRPDAADNSIQAIVAEYASRPLGQYLEWLLDPRADAHLYRRCAIRLRLKSSSKWMEKLRQLRITGESLNSAYKATISYIDLIIFADCAAALVVKIKDVERLDGASVDTMEIGQFLRTVKSIYSRSRRIVTAPEFSPIAQVDSTFSWVTAIDPIVNRISTKPLSSESIFGNDPRFRAVNFIRIARDPKLTETGDELFGTKRARLLFEASTGHDTTDSQEVPALSRIVDFQESIAQQWNNFLAIAFWDDSTFFIEDRTGSVDPPRGGLVDTYARDKFPTQVENNYLWQYLLATHQQFRVREFVNRLVLLGDGSDLDMHAALHIEDDFIRDRNMYWFDETTSSQWGAAISERIEQMFQTRSLLSSVGGELESVIGHYELKQSQRSEANERSTKFFIGFLSIVGIPIGVIATIVADKLSKAGFLGDMDEAGTGQAFLAVFGFLVIFALVSNKIDKLRVRRSYKSRRSQGWH